MGLLDSFLDDPQQSGLLNAAASILAASGPSVMPRSFGQVMASGIGGFQQGAAQADQRALQNQLRQLNGYKIKDAESDYKAQEAKRDEEQRYVEFMRKRGMGGATSPMPAPQSAAASFAGAMNPAMPPQAGDQSAPAAPANMNMAIYQKRLQLAEDLRNAGFGTRAEAEEAAALKFQPKVKGWEKVQQGGKVMFAPFFEDGSSGAPVPLEVAEKLEKVSRGGSTDLVNAYTGAPVASFKTTVSPDAALTAQTAANRLAFDKSQTGKPIFNAELGGFVYAPNEKNPQGTFVPAAGLAAKGPKLTEDQAKATGWLVQAENAWKNMRAVAYGKDGATLTSAATPGFGDAVASLPFGIGEASGQALRSKDRQKFIQGASSLSESLLRAATGAGVNKEEAAQKIRELTPQFGDSEELIKQKMDSIPLYIETLKVRSGGGAAQAANVLATQAPKAAGNGWSITKVN